MHGNFCQSIKENRNSRIVQISYMLKILFHLKKVINVFMKKDFRRLHSWAYKKVLNCQLSNFRQWVQLICFNDLFLLRKLSKSSPINSLTTVISSLRQNYSHEKSFANFTAVWRIARFIQFGLNWDKRPLAGVNTKCWRVERAKVFFFRTNLMYISHAKIWLVSW